MSIKEFNSEDELEYEFEKIMELNFEYKFLQETIKEAQQELEYAEEELQVFEKENKEYL